MNQVRKAASCAITGPRPFRFKFKYNESAEEYAALKKIKNQLFQLYHQGARSFYTGGALGVDMRRPEWLLSLQKEGYADIHLITAIPFNMTLPVPFSQRDRYDHSLCTKTLLPTIYVWMGNWGRGMLREENNQLRPQGAVSVGFPNAGGIWEARKWVSKDLVQIWPESWQIQYEPLHICLKIWYHNA